MAPNISGAGGGQSNVFSQKSVQAQEKTNETLNRVLNTLDSALGGAKPALARAIGDSTTSGLNGLN